MMLLMSRSKHGWIPTILLMLVVFRWGSPYGSQPQLMKAEQDEVKPTPEPTPSEKPPAPTPEPTPSEKPPAPTPEPTVPETSPTPGPPPTASPAPTPTPDSTLTPAPTVSVSPTQSSGRILSLVASPATVDHGTPFSLAGRIATTDGSSACTSGKIIVIGRNVLGGPATYEPFREVTTDLDGAFSIEVAGTDSARYRARVESEDGCEATSSRRSLSLVSLDVSLQASRVENGTGDDKAVKGGGERVAIKVSVGPCNALDEIRITIYSVSKQATETKRAAFSIRKNCRGTTELRLRLPVVLIARAGQFEAAHESGRSPRFTVKAG